MIQSITEKNLIKRPQLKPGDIVRVHQEITEGSKKRIQVFEGMVIRVNHGQGSSATFTVRRISLGVGVEKIFPLHLPTIKKIEITKSSKVRRAKLYYLRGLTGKKARLKDKKLSEDVIKMMATIDEDNNQTNQETEKENKKTENIQESDQKSKPEIEKQDKPAEPEKKDSLKPVKTEETKEPEAKK